MASTVKEEKASRKYYHTHEKYRKKKIADTQKKQKSNRPKYNEEKREYYAKSAKYRKYKREYSKRYHKENPIKSKARKDRKALKER